MTNTQVEPKLLTFEQAAARLSIGVTLLRQIIDAGEIETVRIGVKSRRVPRESCDAYADALPRENNNRAGK
jgi:excisionase family DNA binding protein